MKPEDLHYGLSNEPKPEDGPEGEPDDGWDGMTLPDKLRLIATWLVEDADLDGGEAREYAAVLDEAVERLEALP